MELIKKKNAELIMRIVRRMERTDDRRRGTMVRQGEASREILCVILKEFIDLSPSFVWKCTARESLRCRTLCIQIIFRCFRWDFSVRLFVFGNNHIITAMRKSTQTKWTVPSVCVGGSRHRFFFSPLSTGTSHRLQAKKLRKMYENFSSSHSATYSIYQLSS